jgi:geranylgeranyl pyrophosphate synthase
VFFAECCRIGALAAGAGESQVEAAGRFGLEIGYTYQILDDLLDVTATLSALGKDIQNDLLHGKMTLPYIHCLRQAEGRELLDFPEETPPDADRVTETIRRSGAYDYCVSSAQAHASTALAAITHLEDARLVAVLRAFVDYLFGRVDEYSARLGRSAAALPPV